MTKYEKMARRSRPRAARQQMAETQRQFVRGVLFLIGVTLLIIFIFGDHGLFQLYKLQTRKKTGPNTHYPTSGEQGKIYR
jgi:hypothetical protein